MLYVVAVIVSIFFVFFFKQKTAYEMRISDWSSDVCSSDLFADRGAVAELGDRLAAVFEAEAFGDARADLALFPQLEQPRDIGAVAHRLARDEIGRASCRERVCQYV